MQYSCHSCSLFEVWKQQKTFIRLEGKNGDILIYSLQIMSGGLLCARLPAIVVFTAQQGRGVKQAITRVSRITVLGVFDLVHQESRKNSQRSAGFENGDET